jgi:hypothetical protein
MITVGPIPSASPLFKRENFCAVLSFNDSPPNKKDLRLSTNYFWYPIVENSQWGYGPFYFAWHIYQNFKNNSSPFYFHCFAGINRSPTIAWAVLRTEFDGDIDKVKMNLVHNSRLPHFYDRNVERGHIPSDINEFLYLCKAHPDCSLQQILDIKQGI